jgi:hypothetical protein
MSNSGTLFIKIRSDVDQVRSVVPVEIRDSHLRLLKLPKSPRHVDLAPGLYEISTVLEDGNKYSQSVQVEKGITSTVELQVKEDAPEKRKSRTRRSRGFLTELLAVTGASMIQQTSTTWNFQAQSEVQRVPTALIRVGEQRFLISLPICSTNAGKSSCIVKVEPSANSTVITAWISQKQRAASAMQNMLAAGFFLEAAGVADDAIELLQGKYNDPVGAALGALIMYKTGQLQRRKSWIKNLARDFPWLPDGKVMLVSLLFNDESERERALDLAVAASKQQMLFTENYSLLLGLLRRWPKGSDTEKIHNAIETMASRSPFLNWESICLSYALPEGQ